ncbi:MAG TPA: CCA tRNA nucleotidyltransferase [Ruminococcaceae bacterium]|nr:CCA tRNA nucleotidyltransferase [Oscillospiraceae bacterium]
MAITVPTYVQTALNLLCDSGYEAYAVGGCVRDSLLGRTPDDWDICTSARPEQTQALFAEYHVIPTGIQHGTVTVVLEKPLEITTYRIDGKYSDNRHPESVTFTRNLAEDLSRRDFTVNAMAYNQKIGLVDMFSGAEHLKDGKIVCVGNPDLRFGEDGLRIMRALRFSSVLNFEIDSKTAESVHKNRELLENIAVERIYTELSKLLSGVGAQKIITEYPDVLRVFLPELSHNQTDIERAGRIISKLNQISPDARLSLTALMWVSRIEPQEAFEIMKRLKTDRDSMGLVSQLLSDAKVILPPDTVAIRRFLKNKSREYALSLTAFRTAAELSPDEPEISRIVREVYDRNFCLSLAQLAIGGADLSALGVPKGKAMGDILNALLDRVIDGELQNQKIALTEAVKSMKI